VIFVPDDHPEARAEYLDAVHRSSSWARAVHVAGVLSFEAAVSDDWSGANASTAGRSNGTASFRCDGAARVGPPGRT